MRSALTIWIPALAILAWLAARRPPLPAEPLTRPATPAAARPDVPPPFVPVEAPPIATPEPPSGSAMDERVEGVEADLGLDAPRRDAYRNLLTGYAARFTELHRRADFTNAGSRLNFERDHRLLQQEFDRLVSALLTPEQAK